MTAWAAQDLGKTIKLPPGFSIELFTDQTPNARSLALGEDGTVYVGTMSEGKVYAVVDRDGDGRPEQVHTLASGLDTPNGVAYHQGDLYVAEISRIIKLKGVAGKLSDPPRPDVIYDQYPKEKHHGWKYLRVGPDGKLYAPVGAPCNICLSRDPVFATITRMDLDGKNFEIFARGIRNTVGFDWHPDTGDLYFTDNGRDWLGDDLPPEELNRATKPGQHFGYPFCHAGAIADPEFGAERPCSEFTSPVKTFPAHVAPLGIRFYRGRQFPENYQGRLFVAQHGSWNRSEPQGYRVVTVPFKNGNPGEAEVFAEGWLQPGGEVLGRPVDVLELRDGSILISDDRRGAIYRVTYKKP
jgi:glucose/arabinose dehydrogenase